MGEFLPHLPNAFLPHLPIHHSYILSGCIKAQKDQYKFPNFLCQLQVQYNQLF